MTRSAVILTGNLRTFEQCFDTFKKLCERFHPDIFLCMSNQEFALHPHNADRYDVFNETILTKEILQKKIDALPIFSEHVKKIILIEKSNEQFYLENIEQMDTRKSWLGMDCLNEFCKIQQIVEEVERYETTNNITYDYIIKTRFDVNIDIDSLPTCIQSPNDLVIETGMSNIIYICKHIHVLKHIVLGVKNLFKDITNKEEDCKSIHCMLEYVFKQNNLHVIRSVRCELNRNYKGMFDTKVTLVTAFYDIGRNTWNSYGRKNDVYFKNCRKVLKQRCPIYIFTTEEFKDKILDIRRETDIYLLYTTLIVLPFEQLHYYEYRNRIQELQKNIQETLRSPSEPEFTKPDYIIVIYNKLQMLERVMQENIYNSQWFQWVDFGIHDNMLQENCSDDIFQHILYIPGKFRICGFAPILPSITRNQHYPNHRGTIACSYMGGDAQSIRSIHALFKEEVATIFQEGYINQEQYIVYWILCKHPSLFDYITIHNWDSMAYYIYKSNVHIAVCFAGHLRSYEFCRQNIQEKILTPLKKMGANVYSFLSTWDNDNYGKNDNRNDFTDYESEQPNDAFFRKTFYTDAYGQYSCSTTYPYAVSMHYKIYKAYMLSLKYASTHSIEYDIVLRIRPDIIYDYKIPVHYIQQCLLHKNTIYLPEHSGKYGVVTKYTSDRFFFGHIDAMTSVMNIYENIPELTKYDDFPYSGEGFLWKQIMLKELVMRTFLFGKNIVRKNNIYQRLS